MKIEKINENSISLIIDKDDLVKRNLDIKDLSYGSEKARGLLLEMIELANVEVGFKADAPLAVETVPLKDGDIKFIVTKIDDPDELDARFSRFTPTKKMDISMAIMKALESTFDKFEEALKINQVQGVNEINTENKLEIKHTDDIICIFEFESIDKASDAAKNVNSFNYVSVLYKDEKSKKFFLVLSMVEDDDKSKLVEFNKVVNTIGEYGARIKGGLGMNQAYYEEHYKIIIKEDAVHKLSLL